jgi:arylsulfatase A-like enzyme
LYSPNILIIVADQHRYDCTGYSRSCPVSTPNIDRLAAQGMWFTNAYTPIPVCCPARQAFLNGRRPESFGALWNYGGSLKISALEPSEYSWVRDLKEFGYSTAFIGKWAINPDHVPEEYGFDEYIGVDSYTQWRNKKYPHIQYSGGWMGEIDPVPYNDNISHWLAKKAMDFMDKSDRPWHIRLDFTGPHLPCRPSKEFAAMYRPQEIPQWGGFQENFENKPYIQRQQLYSWGVENYTWEDWSRTVALYYAMVSEIDHAIGTVLDRLDELGLTHDTLVVYTADHGDMCGNHRMVDKHYVLYDDIVKVPLAIRWPRVVKPDTVCHEFVCHFLDLPPTILEILGIKPPEFFHGKSIIPFFKGKKPEGWRQEVVGTYNGQQFGLYTQRMIRTQRWKYIWNTTDIDELYDLEQDPHELENRIYDPNCKNLVTDLRCRLYHILLKEGDGLVQSEWMRHQLLHNRKI